ncbi:MAG: hypothetical protein WC496_02130 [Phycisphaerae bacterium]|jgi:hypothetical protein
MKKLITLILMVAVVGFVFVGVSKAADPNMPKRPMFDPNAIRGRVVVEKDADGAVTAVKIEHPRRGIWNVVLDAKGKELGETMANKIVVVKGTVETKDGVKWVTVESYTEMKRPQRRPGDPNMPRRPGGPGQGGK